MRSTGYDAFQGEIFRKDFTVIIAMKRELAVLGPVRLAPDQGDYKAGQVLARITSGPSTGQFGKYAAGGANGLDKAACVLLENTFGQVSDGGGSPARTINARGNTTNGSPTFANVTNTDGTPLSASDFAAIKPGQSVSSSGLTGSPKVVSVDAAAKTLTLDTNATSTDTNVGINVFVPAVLGQPSVGVATPAIFKGIVYKDKLVGYDDAAGDDLKARDFSDARNVNLLEF